MLATAGGELRGNLIRTLQERIRGWESARRPGGGPIGAGSAALDRLLPGGGLQRGTLVEWLADGAGSGATTLALIAAREACRQGGALVVVDRRRVFYPPAAAALGIELSGTIVVCPNNQLDHDWAVDQALRSAGVAAVLCWPRTLVARTFRRFQLAAESGKGVGLLVRSIDALAQPTWAQVRWVVEPLPTSQAASDAARRLRVRLAHARCGDGREPTAELEIDAETGLIHDAHHVPVASPVDRSAAARRPAGA